MTIAIVSVRQHNAAFREYIIQQPQGGIELTTIGVHLRKDQDWTTEDPRVLAAIQVLTGAQDLDELEIIRPKVRTQAAANATREAYLATSTQRR